MRTISDFYSYCKKNNLKMFGTRSEEYMLKYNENSSSYDLFTNKTYGSMILNVSHETTETEQIEEVQNLIEMAFIINDYKFRKMLDSAQAEFNPIENYDRYEDTDNTFGSRTDLSKMGKLTSTMKNPQMKNTTTSSVVGFDSSDFTNRDKVENVSDANNIINETDAYNNEFEKGEEVDNITSHIHGNIGVTTSTQMLNEFYRFYNWFDFYRIVIESVVNEITLPIYDDILEDFSQSQGGGSSEDIEQLQAQIDELNRKVIDCNSSIANLEGFVETDIIENYDGEVRRLDLKIDSLEERVEDLESALIDVDALIGSGV